jgi:hypothetical protein
MTMELPVLLSVAVIALVLLGVYRTRTSATAYQETLDANQQALELARKSAEMQTETNLLLRELIAETRNRR